MIHRLAGMRRALRGRWVLVSLVALLLASAGPAAAQVDIDKTCPFAGECAGGPNDGNFCTTFSNDDILGAPNDAQCGAGFNCIRRQGTPKGAYMPGEIAPCDVQGTWGDANQDMLRIEKQVEVGKLQFKVDADAPSGAFDRIPSIGGPAYDLDGDVAPSVNPLSTSEGVAVVGNAECYGTCSVGGERCMGDADCAAGVCTPCDHTTGANCQLPCVLCRAGIFVSPIDDSTDGTANSPGQAAGECTAGDGQQPCNADADCVAGVCAIRGSDLQCPGADDDGIVNFVSAEVAVPPLDCAEGQTSRSLVNQGHLVWRQTCEGVAPDAGCEPVTYNQTPDPFTINVACVENPPVPNFKCYSAKPKPGTGFVQKEVVLTDQFNGDVFATVATPFELCTPVRKEGREDPQYEPDAVLNDPGAAHLMCYKLVADTIGPDVLLRATDQFGTLTHRVGNSIVLCQPALKSCEERAEAQGNPTFDCEAAYERSQVEVAHLNCYQAYPEEQPFGQCSQTPQVCSADADCPGFDPEGGGEVCVPLSEAVPFFQEEQLTLTDQFGDTVSDIEEVSFHCNPLFAKTVDGVLETFDPPEFGGVCSVSNVACNDDSDCDTGDPNDICNNASDAFPFPVPDGVEKPQDIHYRCYDIDDTETPEAFQEDPRNRYVTVRDQFGTAEIQVGIGTRLCEPEVKEFLEQEQAQNNRCGLLGIEALVALLPAAAVRRRRRSVGG